MTWKLYFTRQARKDARKLAAARLKARAQELLAILENDPFRTPPPYEMGSYKERLTWSGEFT